MTALAIILTLVALACLTLGLHWGLSAKTMEAANASLALACAGPVLLILAALIAYRAA